MKRKTRKSKVLATTTRDQYINQRLEQERDTRHATTRVGAMESILHWYFGYIDAQQTNSNSNTAAAKQG